MYQSLSKLTPVIFEDPAGEDHETPKNHENRKKKLFGNNYFSNS